MTKTFLTFLLYGDTYAINVDKVLEVLEKQELTDVPNAPEAIQGVLDFRGNVVPVYETSLIFKLSKRDNKSNYFIIVIELPTINGFCQVGAKVDKVKEVISINDDSIKSVPPMSADYHSEAISGIVRIKDDFIMILDVEKLFSDKYLNSITL